VRRIDPKTSVGQIRLRLFVVLLGALGLGLVITLGLMLASVVGISQLEASSIVDSYRPLAARLANDYAGRGGWVDPVGVGEPWEWEFTLLLDADGRVLVDEGDPSARRLGSSYDLRNGDASLPILVNGEQVGALVVLDYHPQFYDYLLTALVPTSLIGVLLVALTLLIGYLIVRRFVDPLADVIAAAQSVAGGDLGARVASRGPGDLRHLIDSFNIMAESLDHNDRARRALLADVTHELRTPLTVMRGRLEGIVDGVYPNDQAHVAPVLNQTYLLERIVDDLHLAALAEAGQLPFDLRPVQAVEVAARVIGVFEADAGERGIALELEIPQPVPPVRADPQRLEQVLGNLVSNAIRYVPTPGRVTVSIEAQGDAVRVAVQDTGPGVAEADLPQLFNRFWRAEKSRSRAAGGAGLGLAIARQLVEAQGGTIRARNQADGGLEVAFTLPCA
jgi:signal transduction histidine kinase